MQNMIGAMNINNDTTEEDIKDWKAQCSSPSSGIKTKYKKYFFGDFLSQQISGKNSESK